MKAKRIIAGAAALSVLAAAALSVKASAANTAVTLSGSKTTAEVGGAFSVEVSLSDIPESKVNVLDFAVTYDNTVLTVTDVAIGAAANTSAIESDTTAADAAVFSTNILDDEICVSWTTSLNSDAWISTDGIILTITGTVADGVADGTVTELGFSGITRETYEGSGTYNSDIVIGYIYGSDSGTYDVTTDPGTVTIGTASSDSSSYADSSSDAGNDSSSEPDESSKDKNESSNDSSSGGDDSSKSVETNPDALYGDVNVDGRIDLTDAVLLNKRTAGLVDFSDEQFTNADINVDGFVTSDDAIYLLQFLVSLITSLPVV